ncbi:MAG TPA: nucleoside 2-deoxyribosyltransferase [Gaiellaceae bacterium]|nr:nucleoside 2-deoxyribosyltransferase [Gaiellaceae bacterium]
MRLYLAGPLFSEAERAWLDTLAARLRAEGFGVFVPHEEFADVEVFTPRVVFERDAAGVRGADALVAWIDGPVVDDGTACEIGLFAELAASDPGRYRGIVAILTDLRLQRTREVPGHGLNLFVAGAIESAGTICWSVEAAIERLRELRDR